MGLYCKGAEFNEFMKDEAVWPKGYWFDDVYCEVNGQYDELDGTWENGVLPEDAKVLIRGGEYHPATDNFYDFEGVLRHWLKCRTHTTVVLDVPKGKVALVHSSVIDIEGVIIR